MSLFPTASPGQIAGLSPAQRLAAARRAEAVAHALEGLRTASPDPLERLRMARHMVLTLPGFDLPPHHLTAEHVSDAALAAHIAGVITLARQLAPTGTPRHLGSLEPAHPQQQGGARYVGPAD